MWKHFTGCVRDTLQRSAHYFDIRCGAGLASNQSNSVVPRKENAIKPFHEKFRCSDNFDGRKTKKNGDQWYDDHLSTSWLNAFTWSGCVVLGWYASQVICISQKRRQWADLIHQRTNCPISPVKHRKTFHPVLLTRLAFAQPPTAQTTCISQDIVDSKDPLEPTYITPVNVSNETPESASNEGILNEAVNDLKDVMSYIENKLGIVALQGGDAGGGLAMLHAAAQRDYAPALYNLAVCYERGLGVKQNDKTAVELYRAAASREHAGAMYNLAVFHGQGRGGLARDPLTADRLLRLAAAKGQEKAIKILQKMTSSKKHPVCINRSTIKEHNCQTQEATPRQSFLNLIVSN